MKPEVFAGLIISAAILIPTTTYVVLRVREFSRNNRYEFASFAYTVRRLNTPIATGHSYRREHLDDLDGVARYILAEWLDSEDGERALAYEPRTSQYSCAVQYAGRVGHAWG